MCVDLDVDELMPPEMTEVTGQHALKAAITAYVAVALEYGARGDARSQVKGPENKPASNHYGDQNC